MLLLPQKVFTLFISALALCSIHEIKAQRQLLLLKKETVKLRLNPGDNFTYRLKNTRSIKKSYINNLSETAVFTQYDTVPIHTIDRVYFRQVLFYNRLGDKLIQGGVLLFLGDQINNTVVQGNKASLDGGVSITSIALIGASLPMILIKKKSQRLNYKYRLIVAEKGSPFYKEEIKSFISPFIPN